MSDLYSLEYISELPNFCLKGVLQCVQNCIYIPIDKVIGYMFDKTVHYFIIIK